MAFQIKDFTSIVASCINWMKSTQKKVTDFNIGSVVRTIIESVASELDELYQQMFNGLKEGIPAATYTSFDFEKIAAIPTSGLLRVTISTNANPVLISAGTVASFENGAISYTVNQDTTIAAGNTFADVLVTASVPGAAGNVVASGTEFTLQPQPDGFVNAQNLSPWINGVDQETDDDRKVRFKAYISSLNRGTVAALDYGLKTTTLTDAAGNVIERVVSASVVEPYVEDPNQPIAYVQCYVHNGVGGTSSALVTRAREVVYGYTDSSGNKVPGWKAAGVPVDVFAAIEQAVDVTGVLTALDGFDKPTLVTQAGQAVYAYIQGLDIGAPALVAEIIAIVMGIDGVYNFVPSAPASDTSVDQKTKLVPGAISIT